MLTFTPAITRCSTGLAEAQRRPGDATCYYVAVYVGQDLPAYTIRVQPCALLSESVFPHGTAAMYRPVDC